MKKQRVTLRIIFLLVWVLGILLPLYSFRRLSPSYRAVFDWVFHTHASHVLMHTFLYAMLACLLASVLLRFVRSYGRVFVCVLAAVAIVAGLQEAIQMICEHVPLGPDEIFDFFVDLNGGMLGTLLFLKISQHRMDKIREVEQNRMQANPE